MPTYEESIHKLYDDRMGTLARIKSRSVEADVLTLTALRVLIYSQLEGGIKEQVALLLRRWNSYSLSIGELPAAILSWRNQDDLGSFRAAVNFGNITDQFPFRDMLTKKVEVKPLNRIHEFNQMSSSNLLTIYTGLRLDRANVESHWSAIDDLMTARNDAAHHGVMPNTAKSLLERQIRQDAGMVEGVLTDLALQSITFFSNQLHRR